MNTTGQNLIRVRFQLLQWKGPIQMSLFITFKQAGQGLRGGGGQIVNLLILHRGYSAEVLALTPWQKARGPGGEGINASRDNMVSPGGHSLCFVGISVIMGSIPYFLFLLQFWEHGRVKKKTGSNVDVKDKYIEWEHQVSPGNSNQDKMLQGDPTVCSDPHNRAYFGSIVLFFFWRVLCLFFFFKCSQVYNLVLPGLLEPKCLFFCHSYRLISFSSRFSATRNPPAREA